MTSRHRTAIEPEIKERPILLSARWVRALLAGRKTQTRRLVTTPKHAALNIQDADQVTYLMDAVNRPGGWLFFRDDVKVYMVTCPFGKPGDRLWVKETFAIYIDSTADRPMAVRYRETDDTPLYGPNGAKMRLPWTSARFMPRGASRINLRVTQVRVQRLQEITEADVRSEGIDTQSRGDFGTGFTPHCLAYEGAAGFDHLPAENGLCMCVARDPVGGDLYSQRLLPWQCAWREAWDALNAATWDANPWVWAVTFERI